MKISNRVKSLVASVAMVVASFGVMATPAFADITCPDTSIRKGEPVKTYADCNVQKDEEGKGLMDTLQVIINVIIGVVGFIAVVMIIIGGISYTTSAGDAGRVKKAKDTIMYGIIGLVIALLAFAIVNFVLTSVFNPTTA